MAGLSLRNLTKIFPGNVVAVRDVNLDIADKEFLVLVGPSGCGKTTTLRMIAGLEEITEGTIMIGNKVVNERAPKDRDIAMVFQNYALYPHMTVYNNMAFGLKLRRLPKAEIDSRVQMAAQILGIGELLNRKPKALSGGQRQRVALGRAIVRKPEAFLFDEPLSNLDAKLRVETRAELKKLHQRLQTTVVYVTHDQLEAMTLGDRIVVLKDGVIQQVDVPLKIYDFPVNQFVAGFLGTPPMNFLTGTLAKANGCMSFQVEGTELKLHESYTKELVGYEGKGLVLGVRPENLLTHDDPAFARNSDAVLNSEVRVIEPMGDGKIVYLSVPGSQKDIVAKVDAHFGIQVGERLQMACEVEKIHLFDSSSGENLVLNALGK